MKSQTFPQMPRWLPPCFLTLSLVICLTTGGCLYSPNPQVRPTITTATSSPLPQRILFSSASIALTTGERADASQMLVLEPESTSLPWHVWQSDNPAIATVNQEGEITAVSPGETQLRVRSADDLEAVLIVTVTEHKQS